MDTTSGKQLCIDKFGTVSQKIVSTVIYCAVIAKLSTPVDSMMYISHPDLLQSTNLPKFFIANGYTQRQSCIYTIQSFQNNMEN